MADYRLHEKYDRLQLIMITVNKSDRKQSERNKSQGNQNSNKKSDVPDSEITLKSEICVALYYIIILIPFAFARNAVTCVGPKIK